MAKKDNSDETVNKIKTKSSTKQVSKVNINKKSDLLNLIPSNLTSIFKELIDRIEVLESKLK